MNVVKVIDRSNANSTNTLRFPQFSRKKGNSRFGTWDVAAIRISDDRNNEIYVPGVPAIRSYSVYLARFIVTTLSRGIQSFVGSFSVWIGKLCLYIIKAIASYHLVPPDHVSMNERCHEPIAATRYKLTRYTTSSSVVKCKPSTIS
jgi:hypothetical protein